MAIAYCEASDCDPNRTPSTCQAIQLAMLDVNLHSKQTELDVNLYSKRTELDKQAGSAIYL